MSLFVAGEIYSRGAPRQLATTFFVTGIDEAFVVRQARIIAPS
jgi:hypothetical protein